MTEAEWLQSKDLPLLIKHVRSVGWDRKLRLFACACARRVWDLLNAGNAQEAVEVAERFADGGVSMQELAAAHAAGMKAWSEAGLTWASIISCGMSVAIKEASAAALYTAMHAPNVNNPAGTPHRRTAKEAERNTQLALLRDIIGNPFRPAIIDPAWLAWNDGTIPKLAQSIYDERAFDRMPILADALEEAGCADGDILNHCRQSSEHVRGCWVVDLVRSVD